VLQDRRSKLIEDQAWMSHVGDESGTEPSRLGAELRKARERLGYDLPMLAEALRIRLAYLEALEAGRFDALPGMAYALGFLRTYAMSLGLEPEDVLRRFKEETDAASLRPELDFPAPVTGRALPAGAIALLGFLLAVGAYAGWYSLSGRGKLPAEAVMPVPARLAPLAQQAVPPPPPVPERVPVEPPKPAPTLAETVTFAPTQAAAMPLPPPPAPPPPVVSAPVPAAAVAGGESRIVIRVKDTVWLQVRDRNGPVLFDRVLRAGETYSVPNRPGLTLSTGNALMTEFLVDGEVTAGLGGAKGVRRGLVMDAEMIKDGRFAQQAGAAAQAPSSQSPTSQSPTPQAAGTAPAPGVTRPQ
jgi:cytoskeleton protein RodZ